MIVLGPALNRSTVLAALTALSFAQAPRQSADFEWPMPAKDYASTRFSTLDQINRRNVAGVKLAWTFSTGVNRGHEAAPLVVNGVMYVVTPFPNLLYALD